VKLKGLFYLILAEHHIRVVAVCPGAIETEMNREEIDKFGRENLITGFRSAELVLPKM